jgi:hypothetical protein
MLQPHSPKPSADWRSAALRVTTLDDAGHPSGEPWLTTAGQFQAENADAVCTASLRAVAEGRRAALQVGGGAAPLFRITLATSAELLAARNGYAGCAVAAGPATSASADVSLPRWVGVEAELEIGQILDRARTEVATAGTRRDDAIAALGEAQDMLRIAENRLGELSQTAQHLASATRPGF